MRWVILIPFLFLVACRQESDLFDTIRSQSEVVDKFFQSRNKFEVQVVYTQIDRDESGKASLTTNTYNYDSTRYFYPASTVKMPVAFLALQRLKELGIDRNATMKIDSSRPPQSVAFADSTANNDNPSVAHYIEKIFAVSDNDAYNRLYEFLGQDYINTQLREKEIFTNSRIVTRVGVSGFNTEDNRYTNPVSFYNEDGDTLYHQEEYKSENNYFLPLNGTMKGKGYYVDDLDTVIYDKFSMGEKNFINLKDLAQSMMTIIFPELSTDIERFDIDKEDYSFLYQAMQKLPREHSYLKDESDTFYDSYVKFFLFGDKKEPMPEHIKIFNKVGFAYGYLTDCAYIIDVKKGVEFFLTATVHVNDNQIYNDGNYEYEEGIEFLAELGRVIYDLELTRERKHTPDFSKYLVRK